METVTLAGNLTVTRAALDLALALEFRGHVLTAKDGDLRVTNGATLTTEDRAAIRAQRWHLMALAAYRAPERTL